MAKTPYLAPGTNDGSRALMREPFHQTCGAFFIDPLLFLSLWAAFVQTRRSADDDDTGDGRVVREYSVVVDGGRVLENDGRRAWQNSANHL